MPAAARANRYGYHWRTKIRPAVLARDGRRCVRCGDGDRPRSSGRSYLEIAHLDPNGGWDLENLATMCVPCHKREDYPTWAPAQRAAQVERREQRIDAKDAARPILAYIREAS